MTTTPCSTNYSLDTDEFADLQRVKGQSVRARVCRTGSYFGVRPLKLANGRLAWPNLQLAKRAVLEVAP